jgi:hypothetical protein
MLRGPSSTRGKSSEASDHPDSAIAQILRASVRPGLIRAIASHRRYRARPSSSRTSPPIMHVVSPNFRDEIQVLFLFTPKLWTKWLYVDSSLSLEDIAFSARSLRFNNVTRTIPVLRKKRRSE